MSLSDLAGNYKGEGELWLDPKGNDALTYACSMTVTATSIAYEWEHEGEKHTGTITPDGSACTWQDSFHHAQPVLCSAEGAPNGAALKVLCTYDAAGQTWGWRMQLAARPDGTIVLGMTNVTPWGEEGRAVRMAFARA